MSSQSRIRTVKPDFWTDEKVVSVSVQARLLLIGMLNFADDYGNQQDSPIKIKMLVFPADNCNTSELLEELVNIDLLTRYEVDGKSYLHINGFSRHQKIDKPSSPRVPLMPNQTIKSCQLGPLKKCGISTAGLSIVSANGEVQRSDSSITRENVPVSEGAFDEGSTRARRVVDEGSLQEVEVEEEVNYYNHEKENRNSILVVHSGGGQRKGTPFDRLDEIFHGYFTENPRVDVKFLNPQQKTQIKSVWLQLQKDHGDDALDKFDECCQYAAESCPILSASENNLWTLPVFCKNFGTVLSGAYERSAV